MTIELHLAPDDGQAFIHHLDGGERPAGVETIHREGSATSTVAVTVSAAVPVAEQTGARLVAWVWDGLSRYSRDRVGGPATIRITAGEVICDVTVPIGAEGPPDDLVASVVDVLANRRPEPEAGLPARRQRISGP